MPTETSTKLTYEDYVNLPDDGNRYEIIDGELYVNPSPNTKHQIVLRNLFRALDRYVEQSGAGEVFVAPFDVVLTNNNIFQPDLLFVSTEHLSILTKANIKGVPDIVVEILSEGTRRKDETTKLLKYEESGVQEYWIIDPEDDVVHILRLSGEKYERIIVGGNITSPLLPGFSVTLKAIFIGPRYV